MRYIELRVNKNKIVMPDTPIFDNFEETSLFFNFDKEEWRGLAKLMTVVDIDPPFGTYTTFLKCDCTEDISQCWWFPKINKVSIWVQGYKTTSNVLGSGEIFMAASNR